MNAEGTSGGNSNGKLNNPELSKKKNPQSVVLKFDTYTHTGMHTHTSLIRTQRLLISIQSRIREERHERFLRLGVAFSSLKERGCEENPSRLLWPIYYCL